MTAPSFADHVPRPALPFAKWRLALILALVAVVQLGASAAAQPAHSDPSWHIVRFFEGGQFWERASRSACEAAQGEDGVICVPGAADATR